MSNLTSKLRRREFLTGAATVIGSGALSAIPGLATAAQGSTLPTSGALGVYFWNGFQFVLASQMVPRALNGQTALVRLEGFGTSSYLSAVDIRMPGGIFHAYTQPPQGAKVCECPVALTFAPTLNFIVYAGSMPSPISIHAGSGPGPKLAAGTYMITEPGVVASMYSLIGPPESPVVGADGQPVTIPYLLISVTVQ